MERFHGGSNWRSPGISSSRAVQADRTPDRSVSRVSWYSTRSRVIDLTPRAVNRQVGNVCFDRLFEDVEVNGRERRVHLPRNIDWLQVSSRNFRSQFGNVLALRSSARSLISLGSDRLKTGGLETR